MFCLRFWAIVPLLPFPTAPPLFSLLWLVSAVILTRPCLYCCVMLICIFSASCYVHLASSACEPAAHRCWLDWNHGKLLTSLRQYAPSSSEPTSSALGSQSTSAQRLSTTMTNSTINMTAPRIQIWFHSLKERHAWLQSGWSLPLGDQSFRLAL
ncbi:hypothetical protein ACM66B_004619 [Microbotryomycetes sp. NB124-2]